MTFVADLLMILGFLVTVITSLVYAFFSSKFKNAMNAYSDRGLFDLGMDTLSSLFGPGYGTKEAQNFFFKKLYLKHPDPAVVKAAHNMYRCAVVFLSGMVAIVFSMIVRAIFGD